MSDRPPLLWYCQHSVGLGHLMRSYTLCAALSRYFRVVLVCGGALPDGIRPPAGVQVLALPPLGVGAAGRFVSHDARYSVEDAWTVRRKRILAAYRTLRPAAVVVELFPFGRAKFAREVVPLLAAARADGALTASSVRDLLVSARPDQHAHDDRAAGLANEHLDVVLVHSDPRFARLEETFAPRRRLRVPILYTGFVVRDGAAPLVPHGRHVVVSVGGGLVGEPLLHAAAEAQPAAGVPLRLIGGPLMPQEAWQRVRALAGPDVELRRTVPDLGAELRAARASVSQGGYNTALEVLRSGVPGLIVPYATPEEDEQLRRARRLERLGAVRVLAPDQLDRSDARPRAAPAAHVRAAPGGRRPRRRRARRAPAGRARGRAPFAGRGGAGMSPATRMLRPHVARRWRALAGAGVATVALAAANLAKPWPLALVVDRLLAQRSVPFTLDAGDLRLLTALAAAVLAIAIIEAGAQYASDLKLQAAGERISHDLRVRVYEHLQRLSLGFHQRSEKGDLVTRVTGDVNAMGDLFSQSLGSMVQAGLLSVGMAAVLLVIDPVLAAVALSTAPVTAALSYVYRRRVRSQARLRRTQEGHIASIASEALSAMAVVKAFGSEGYESRRVREGSELRLASGVEVARLQARFDGLVGAVRAVATALVLVLGAVRVSQGAISAGELLVFASYTRKAQGPMRSFARELTKVSAALAKADRIAELLAADDVLPEPPGAHRGGRAAGELALEDVSFGYGPDRPVLAGLSLRVRPGERLALMGPSGAGKSTLGALVARLFDPTAGRVLLDGRDARDCALEWWREQVAVVLQDTVLFSGTVHENIAYAVDATRDEVIAAARATAAHEFICALPLGYDTDLGPQGVALSGGQRQRIGIARTLLRDPPVLVLDEPTTGLDADSEAAVLDGLQELMRGRTTILITHAPRLARTADRVVELAGGAIVRAPRVRERTLPLERLLDPQERRALIARALGSGDRLGDVEVARVVYKPHDTVAVHYRAVVDGRERDAVATSIVGVDLEERIGRPSHAALARKAERRSAAPAHFDGALGALVTWLPFDPKLPALAEERGELERRLGTPLGAEPELVGYKPRGRAVLRANGLVLKAYGASRQFEAALAGLRTAGAGPLRTGTLAAAVPELRLIAQRLVAGRRPESAADVAATAGALAAELQGGPASGLIEAPPERHLAAAARKAELIGAVLPALRPRADALVASLRRDVPSVSALVPAHGDFHVDQLLVGERVAVVDFDQMCLAAPALDLATYAADVVRGRDGDLAAVAEVLDPLLDGYGGRPAALEWHLSAAILARTAHPFQRQLPDWPGRVEAMLAAAEELRG